MRRLGDPGRGADRSLKCEAKPLSSRHGGAAGEVLHISETGSPHLRIGDRREEPQKLQLLRYCRSRRHTLKVASQKHVLADAERLRHALQSRLGAVVVHAPHPFVPRANRPHRPWSREQSSTSTVQPYIKLQFTIAATNRSSRSHVSGRHFSANLVISVKLFSR